MTFTSPFTVVNAPAGSGKTTSISTCIKSLVRNTNKKILCITYTNRATEQLISRIDDEKVEISTIHSFISNLLAPFFTKREIIDLYFEFFSNRINQILNSQEPKEIERIDKYRNRKEIGSEVQINMDIVRGNAKNIYYSETQFSSFLYGGLSHDDLLIIAKEIFIKFPKIQKNISQIFSYVFIDEYQDTKTEILELFYQATMGTPTKLILLGDEMQQIYNDTVEDFHKVIEKDFYKENSLTKNWRSQKHIVTILNNLYFDKSYKQDAVHVEGEKPKVHIVDNFDDLDINKGVLQLVLRNQELFDQIGAGNLFRAFNEKYHNFEKYNSKQILTDISAENPDELMSVLIFIADIVELFNSGKHGKLLQKVTQFKYSNLEFWKIVRHIDKLKIHTHMECLCAKVMEDINLKDLLAYLSESEFIDAHHIEDVMDAINENEPFMEKIYSVKYVEFLNCYNECSKQSVSTQHAVKGEGHNAIALKLVDASSLNVQMHLFLELWSKNVFDYKYFKKMNSDIKLLKEACSKSIGTSLSTISNELYKEKNDKLYRLILEIIEVLNKQESIYNYPLIKNCFETYINKSNVTNFKKCMSMINKFDGVILAYKLFYVGCSRAKEKLDVFLCLEKIQEFITDFTSKMESIGFEVINESSVS